MMLVLIDRMLFKKGYAKKLDHRVSTSGQPVSTNVNEDAPAR